MHILYFTAYSTTTVTLKVAVEILHIPVLEQGMKFFLTSCMNQNYVLLNYTYKWDNFLGNCWPSIFYKNNIVGLLSWFFPC